MARRMETAESKRELGEVESEKLEPIRMVERVLTRPDGTTVRVEVPVYPPFRLKERPARAPDAKAPGRKRSTG